LKRIGRMINFFIYILGVITRQLILAGSMWITLYMYAY
jgi:hypothetical protein